MNFVEGDVVQVCFFLFETIKFPSCTITSSGSPFKAALPEYMSQLPSPPFFLTSTTVPVWKSMEIYPTFPKKSTPMIAEKGARFKIYTSCSIVFPARVIFICVLPIMFSCCPLTVLAIVEVF